MLDLVSRLEAYRAEEQQLAWRGTFKEYFEQVVANPRATRLSHARVYDMLMAGGVETLPNGDKKHGFFKDELFGIERPLQHLVDYFASAARRLEVRKRILLLMGPVGGGKSTIVSMLKRGQEAYSRTDDGAVYSIAGCPMHEEPLHLLPDSIRKEVMAEHGIYIEGDLCPRCRHMVDEEYGGRIEDVEVCRVAFSEKKRVGIGTFSPSDPKSQDISELTGSIDLATIGDYGVESDPRAYRFDGELNVANRGLMEFVEMLKCLRGDTLVLTASGIRRLDSFAEADQPVEQSRPIDVRLATANGVEPSSHIFRAGVKPTKRITTQRGFMQEGAYEHRALVVNDEGVQVWRRHDELQVGDWLVLQRAQSLWGDDVTLPVPAGRDGRARGRQLPVQMSPELARWLGYLVAEGDTQANGLIRFTNGDPELRADFTQLTVELFGVSPAATRTGLQFGSVRVLDFMVALGWQSGATRKVVPWAVLQSSRESMLQFLAGYFAGDGSVGLHGRLWWVTASEELARQLQIVLLNLGVVSRRTSTSRLVGGERRSYWQVAADGRDADLLAAAMPLLPLAKRTTYEARSATQTRSGRTDVIPNVAGYWLRISDALQRTVIAEARAVGGTGYRGRVGARQVLGSDYQALHGFRSGLSCTRDGAAAILDKLDGRVETPPGLASLLNAAQVYDRVVSIEDGEAECWDLHVPGSNTYVANGIVNHNCDEKFLYNLLTLSQEQSIKTGRFAMIYADEVIVSHTNEHEYNAFIANKKSEALHDRIILIKVPYNLKVTEEVKIYEKLIGQSNLQGVHIAPNTLRVASMFAVLSRLEQSRKAGMSLMKKLKLYDGEEVDDFGQKDIRELQDEATREGMDGISPRYVINALSTALVRGDTTCINPIDALRALRDGMEHSPGLSRERREELLNLIAETRREYDELGKKEVQRAFVYSFEQSAKTLLDNYLDNVEAFCNKTKMRDPITEDEVDPDEQLMRSVEEQIGISENAKKAFREEILIRLSSMARRGQSFTYRSHERLREAIEKKLFADLKDVVKITTSTKTPDAEQLRRINDVCGRLIAEQGYCPVCANELVKYVGALLSR
ncbi:MAG: LAGLIDADG family homing endonuclease [Chloroflexota bacterium]